jgi:hypothetical protein
MTFRDHMKLMLKEMRFASGLYLGVALGSMFGFMMCAALFYEFGCAMNAH